MYKRSKPLRAYEQLSVKFSNQKLWLQALTKCLFSQIQFQFADINIKTWNFNKMHKQFQFADINIKTWNLNKIHKHNKGACWKRTRVEGSPGVLSWAHVAKKPKAILTQGANTTLPEWGTGGARNQGHGQAERGWSSNQKTEGKKRWKIP